MFLLAYPEVHQAQAAVQVAVQARQAVLRLVLAEVLLAAAQARQAVLHLVLVAVRAAVQVRQVVLAAVQVRPVVLNHRVHQVQAVAMGLFRKLSYRLQTRSCLLRLLQHF